MRVGLGADQHGHVGMVDDVVTDAAQNGTPHYACAAAANHDHRTILFFNHFADSVADAGILFKDDVGVQLEIQGRGGGIISSVVNE